MNCIKCCKKSASWRYGVRMHCHVRLKLLLRVLLACFTLAAVIVCWWLSHYLMSPPSHELQHFKRNRSLGFYLDAVNLVIEPSSSPCENMERVPLVVLVPSSPLHFHNRDAIRNTWAKYQPTIFVLGLLGSNVEKQLVDNYIEAKTHSDLVVFDFIDHYQNLTIKTALMLQWTLRRCPQAEFMMKTDDDVLVNPWTTRTLLKEHKDAPLVGYKLWDAPVQRNLGNKWYMPKWMYPEERIPEYLSGPSYLINGEYIEIIYKTAFKVPMINLEDVFFTFLVAIKSAKLSLVHDRRLSKFKPWFPIGCAYFTLASVHGVTPQDMVIIWSKVAKLEKAAESGEAVCNIYKTYFFNDWYL